jgi:hypothetical protein
VRRLVLALAENSEREGEQEDQNRDHDNERQTLAHPISSLEPRVVPPFYNKLDEPFYEASLLDRVMYNVATCSSFVR